ncbi:hypothetical protein [Anaerophaga thermohalophila]|uniref:hypothetical protein n=1 Tax=Anaerophaga thermohalophila TaxID=177400 RepID=UPI0011476D95|nr:hypothetical protein [Anaerophaga thermohalophila]
MNRFKMQCNKFSGTITKELGVIKKRLVKEMIFGIQASKDVKLSNISRSLKEDIPLIKTEDRLSRNLASEDLSEQLNKEIMRLASGKIDDTMVIAIDPGDIMKPYAKEMEKLCNIYDGSSGRAARGYHLCQVTAANLAHDRIVPLYCEAYSSEDSTYPGRSEKIIEIVQKVKSNIGSNGTWAIDREGDDIDIIRGFTSEELDFVVRLKMNRYLHFAGNINRQVKAERIQHHVATPYKAHIYITKDGKEEFIHLQFGAVKVALPEYPDIWYTLVIVKGFGKHPMLLLTNKEVNLQNNKQLWQIVDIYLTRWKCDECYRYIKQSYNLEDIRVLSYNSIRNITVLVHCIAYFTSIYIGMSLKLKIMVQKIFILSKRFFGVPTFFNYAMADGIYELLKHSRKGIADFKSRIGPHHNQFQLSLFPD